MKKYIYITENDLKRKIQECLTSLLTEGIDVDDYNLTVSYNPSHENNVETSEYTNQTVIHDKYVPNVSVWSIFKRKVGCKDDGNPLVYALKGEKNWRFKTDNDRKAVFRQINLIASKFFNEHKYPITIMLPSNGPLNNYLLLLAKRYNKEIETIDDMMVKLQVQEVRDMILEPNSLFRKTFVNERDFNRAIKTFDKYTSSMTDGVYRSHYMKNPEIRSVIEQTFKVKDDDVYKYIKAINNKDILILDDNVGFGSSIRNACDEILTFYSPKSITVLTLFSEKYDSDGNQINRI